MGRVIKRSYSPGAKVVFIGPCIAKKAEIDDPQVAGDVDAVLTFVELETMLREAGIELERLPIFPVTRLPGGRPNSSPKAARTAGASWATTILAGSWMAFQTSWV